MAHRLRAAHLLRRCSGGRVAAPAFAVARHAFQGVRFASGTGAGSRELSASTGRPSGPMALTIAEAYDAMKSLGGEGCIALDTQSHAAQGVAILRLVQPRHRNALTPAMMVGLFDALNELDKFDGRACLLLGEGGQFCSGLDLKNAALLQPEMGVAINSERGYPAVLLSRRGVGSAAPVQLGRQLARAPAFNRTRLPRPRAQRSWPM